MMEFKIETPKVSSAILFILWIIWFFCSIVFYNSTNYDIDRIDWFLYFFSLAGVLQFILTLKNIKDVQGQLFSPYFIFYCFLFVFNFGQFAMWSIGLHDDGEMTVTRFIRFIDKQTALKMQVISLELLAAVHMGVLFSSKFHSKRLLDVDNENCLRSAYKTIALPILIVSGIVNIVYVFIGFSGAMVYGYSAYFVDSLMPPYLKYISYMFIPSFFLTLIAYDFSKKIFWILTLVFLLYDLPLFISGDRGSWVYFIGVWLWTYVAIVSKKNGNVNPVNSLYDDRTRGRKIFVSLIVLGGLIYLGSLFFSVRDVGLSYISSYDFDFSDLTQPFVHPFFEMGQSAVLLGVIIQDNLYQTWQFGNTYISEILGMVLPRISTLFGYEDFYLENWFSSYLRMGNYGVGFSAFAEAFLNGGVLFSSLYMVCYGFFIGRNVLLAKGVNVQNSALLFFCLASTVVLIPTTRNSLQLYIRQYFWGIVFIQIISSIIASYRLKRLKS